MKKRLFCLLLALVLAVPMILTACSNEDETEADVGEDLGAQTITMRMLTDKKVFNTDAELAEFLEKECGGDENNPEYIQAKKVMETYERVEYEFSKITKSKYKVNVDFIFYTEDEYNEEIEKTMDEYALEMVNSARAKRALMKYINDYNAAYPEAGYPLKRLGMEFLKYYPEFKEYIDLDSIFLEEDDKSNNVANEQYKENDYGIQELVYPETLPGQIDIIYISGYDMYSKYIENEWILALDEHISTTGKKLNDYIPSALLQGVKYDGSTYAIPNNVQIGEYTYMMVDKELFDKYYHDYRDVESVLDLEDFFDDLTYFESGYAPLDATFKDCMDQFVWYWNIDWTTTLDENGFEAPEYTINKNNDFSLIGALYGDPENAGRGKIQLGFNNLFTDSDYRDIYLQLKKYEFNKYYKEEGDERPAAVFFENGDYSVKKEADLNDGVYTDENGKEYYAYIVKYPEAQEKELYGNMYAISANSKHIKACMEVITLINTNSEARNILQYGVEGVDYTIDGETGSLKRLKTEYRMDIEKTGNCFIAHPEEGLPADYWENSKKQNNDALINPLLGFDFNKILKSVNTDRPRRLDNEVMDLAGLDSDTALDPKLYPDSVDLATQVLTRLEECISYEELVATVDSIAKLMTPNENGAVFMTVKDAAGKEWNNHPLIITALIDPAYVPEDGGDDIPDEETETLAPDVVPPDEETTEAETGTGTETGTETGDTTESGTAPEEEAPDALKAAGESPYKLYYDWMVQNGYLPQ